MSPEISTTLIFGLMTSLIIVAILMFVLVLWAGRVMRGNRLQGDLDVATVSLENLRDAIAVAEARQTELSALALDQADLAARIGTLTNQRDALEVEIRGMDGSREELLELAELRDEHVANHAEALRDLTEKRAELDEIEGRLGRMRSLESDIPRLEARERELRHEIGELEGQTADLRALKADAARLTEEAERLARVATEREVKVGRLEERIAIQEAEIGTLRAAADGQRARRDALVEEVEKTQVALTPLQAEREKLGSEVARLTDERRVNEAAVVRLEDQTGRQEDRLQEAAAAARELSRRCDALRVEAETERDSLVVLRAEHERLTQGQVTLATLEAQIEAARKTRDGLAGSGTGGNPEEALSDLVRMPEVLKLLRKEPESRDSMLQEDEALQRVRAHLDQVGLTYPDRTLHAFHTALKVNDHTQITVLAGISGTGKSQLPRRYAEAMGIGFLPVPVQPRWNSPQDLMGFYNYIERRYRATDLARTMWQMDRWRDGADPVLGDRMMLILLDEMNLARVEYYFSDFLSRLESRPPRAEIERSERRRDAELVVDLPSDDANEPPRIFPGFNVLFAGTMNEDESTQALSDKVVDRANVLRFAAPREGILQSRQRNASALEAAEDAAPMPRKLWEAWHRTAQSLESDVGAVSGHIERLAGLMSDAGRPFGHRLRTAMMEYVANYPRRLDAPLPIAVAMADQVEMRLLPKLRGVELNQARDKLSEIASYVDETLQDRELADAIEASLQASEELGQFQWSGTER